MWGGPSGSEDRVHSGTDVRKCTDPEGGLLLSRLTLVAKANSHSFIHSSHAMPTSASLAFLFVVFQDRVSWGWRDSSVVKSTDCFYEGPEFKF